MTIYSDSKIQIPFKFILHCATQVIPLHNPPKFNTQGCTPCELGGDNNNLKSNTFGK